MAGYATSTADGFEQVFDLRVMQALDRMGLPAGAIVRELATRIAQVTGEIDRLVQALPLPRVSEPAKQAARPARKAASGKTGRRVKRSTKTLR